MGNKRKGRRPTATATATARPRSGGGGGSKPQRGDQEGDYCFACKDGGLLRLCDYRNCHKAYHPECVGKDDDFLNSDEEFICDWHTCFICKGHSYYRCFCCPGNSVCRGCLTQAEFVQVTRQTKGFCTNCLRMAIMIEKNVEVDSDGERVDFSDRETYEFLFKEYWEIVNEKEGLTLENLQEAYAHLKSSANCNHMSDSEHLHKEECSSDDDFVGDSDDGYDDPICPSAVNGTSNKVKAFLKQGNSKKNIYVGWGSKELIGFLSSVGKDTSISLDQFGAAEVVKDYIRQEDLLQKDKKKHVICDDKLWSLFRKSKLKYNKIYSLLERHIAANTTSEDETLASSEDNSDLIMKKKTRTMTSQSCTPKGISERNKRCFASLVRDNIKLIYLKRSLVMDLLKQPETFENKVTGCFVRVKNDPKDYCYQKPKKLYQLGQVTGIRKSSEEYKIRDISTNVLLCISSIGSEVKISMLSDEDFEEDECEDLRLLVQKEHCERHTVAELEEKARSVHRDIVSHRIVKELQRLEKLIEMANEKGWRYEMHEYIDKRQLLRTPSERQRLLQEVPQVIPDAEDNEESEFVVATPDKSFQKNAAALQGASGEEALCLESCSEEISKGTDEERAICLRSRSKEKSEGVCPKCSVNSLNGGLNTDFCVAANEERAVCLESCSEEKPKGANEERTVCLRSCSEEKSKATEADANSDTPGTCVRKQVTTAAKVNAAGDTPGTLVKNEGTQGSKANAAGDKPGMHVQKQATAAGITTQVINIDDDEDSSVHVEGGNTTVVDLDADEFGNTHLVQHEIKHTSLWYYMDPHDDEQGPFSIELLRVWKKAGYFDDDFRVWRAGQSSDSAILLTDALRLTR